MKDCSPKKLNGLFAIHEMFKPTAVEVTMRALRSHLRPPALGAHLDQLDSLRWATSGSLAARAVFGAQAAADKLSGSLALQAIAGAQAAADKMSPKNLLPGLAVLEMLRLKQSLGGGLLESITAATRRLALTQFALVAEPSLAFQVRNQRLFVDQLHTATEIAKLASSCGEFSGLRETMRGVADIAQAALDGRVHGDSAEATCSKLQQEFSENPNAWTFQLVLAFLMLVLTFDAMQKPEWADDLEAHQRRTLATQDEMRAQMEILAQAMRALSTDQQQEQHANETRHRQLQEQIDQLAQRDAARSVRLLDVVARVRSQPKGAAHQVATLGPGDVVLVLHERGRWIKVAVLATGGQAHEGGSGLVTGWIPKSAASRLDRAP